ncbi:MAG: ArgE/DapE family deacylase [Nitrososphaerales archaeon]
MTKLSDRVEYLKADLIKLASLLIKTGSENPPGDTSKVAIVIEDYLKSIGLGSRLIEPMKGHVNVMTSIGSGDYGLILCGHVDTVPIGDLSKWSFDPFSGEIMGGYILGRGATDMKGGVASIITAINALIEYEKILNEKIVVALFCDEETGGHYGARWIIQNQLIKGKAMIIGEPSNYHRSGHVIIAGERGVLWSRLKFDGFSHHGSRPMLGDNAIMHAVKALSKLKSPIISKVRTPYEAVKLVRWGKKVLTKEYEDRKSLKPQYALDHYTLNIGVIKGGVKANVVADSCEVEIDLRIPIGGSKEEAEKIIRSLTKEGKVEYFNYAPPSFTPLGSNIIKVLRKVSRSVFKENTPVICIAATTDAHYFRSALKIPVVSYGPGYEDLCHVYDERVDVNDLLGCAKVYAETAMLISS